MPDPKSPRDILAETMAGGRKVLVPHLAEMLKHRGITEVSAAEERERFYQAAITDEQEQRMWQDEALKRGITEWVPGSPEALDAGLAISKVKYPARWDMSAAEGRNTVSDIATWAMKHARAGPPSPRQETA